MKKRSRPEQEEARHHHRIWSMKDIIIEVIAPLLSLVDKYHLSRTCHNLYNMFGANDGDVCFMRKVWDLYEIVEHEKRELVLKSGRLECVKHVLGELSVLKVIKRIGHLGQRNVLLHLMQTLRYPIAHRSQFDVFCRLFITLIGKLVKNGHIQLAIDVNTNDKSQWWDADRYNTFMLFYSIRDIRMEAWTYALEYTSLSVQQQMQPSFCTVSDITMPLYGIRNSQSWTTEMFDHYWFLIDDQTILNNTVFRERHLSMIFGDRQNIQTQHVLRRLSERVPDIEAYVKEANITDVKKQTLIRIIRKI